MTFLRAGSVRTRARRRNRKRPTPIWRRRPDLGGAWRWIKPRLRRGVPLAIAVVIAAAVVMGGYYGYRFITTSQRFAVRAIEVRGNQTVTSDRIQALMGVNVGENIFTIELAAMERAIEREPMIAAATVRRQLPATLMVEIEEMQPVALVELDGLYLADGEGRVFKRAAIARGEGRGLPVITGLSRAAYIDDPGAVQANIHDALGAFEVYRSGQAAFARPELGEINIDPRHGITFITYEHAVAVRVGHGDADTLHQRLQAFDRAWQALTENERSQARFVYAQASIRSNPGWANRANRANRVTIGFDHTEKTATE